jgi:hypothetical protein
MQGYIFLATFSTQFEAKLIESKLSERGIPTFLKRLDGYPQLPSDRIDIFVNPEDFDRAKALITSGEDALTSDTDTSSS